jgi:uncharacterized protein (DUF302 family)
MALRGHPGGSHRRRPRSRGRNKIPGNTVIGVFDKVFAARILRLSTAAIIEAPVRLYLTANADGTASLSCERPSAVFATCADEGGAALAAAAFELDGIFAAIAAEAAAR